MWDTSVNMNLIFKRLFKLLILFAVLNNGCFAAKDFSGTWSSNCKSVSNPASVMLITRADKEGLYQVGYSGFQKSSPTPIIGDKDFKVINDENIVYKNTSFQRCSISNSTKYSPNLEHQIKKYLQGEWKVKYQERAGIKNNISNGKLGLPDLTFINKDEAKISLKNEVRPVYYKVKGDNIVLKTEHPNPFKVHMIDEKELRLSFEVQPASGVFIYYRYGYMK